MDLMQLALRYADLSFFVPQTRETFLRSADLYCRRAGVTRVDEISLESVIKFKNETLKVAKPVTFNGYLRYLRPLGEYLVDENLIECNVFKKLRLASTGKVRPKVLASDEIQRALNLIDADPQVYDPPWFWRAVIMTLFYTGMRRRQLAALTVGDVNLVSGILLLSYRSSKTHREWSIPIHEDLIDELQELLVRLRKTLGRPLKASDPIFNRYFLNYRYRGEPGNEAQLKPTAFTDFFKRLKKRADINLSAHGFRHTFATQLCNPPGDSNPDLLTVQSMLGHTMLSTTRGYVQTKTSTMKRTIQHLSIRKFDANS